MGAFDNFMSKAKDVAMAAGKKTEETIEISKLKMQRSAAKGDIEKIKTRLGAIVYQSKKSDVDYTDQINECIKEIDSIYATIESLNKEIEKFSSEDDDEIKVEFEEKKD